jgi:serine/threonine protein kinase
VGDALSSLCRANLAERIDTQLSSGGWTKAQVTLACDGERFVVVKDFAAGGASVRRLWGRLLLRRELRAYRALVGHPSVPRVIALLDDWALVLEYRPGTLLSRSLQGKLPADFVQRLREAIELMHERGVAHLDLRHRSNILAGADGRPVLIDFASAICFRPGGLGARLVLPWLARIDRGALAKWEIRLRGDPAASSARG